MHNISFASFLYIGAFEKLISKVCAESRNGMGEPICRGESGTCILVGLSFDPNPSANLVSVGREGD